MTLADELGLNKKIETTEHETLLNIYYTANRIRKAATVFFKQYGLTDVQFNLLALLLTQCDDQRGLTQVELSRMMLVNRANMTGLIDRMEKADLVERRRTDDDRRRNLIHLTDEGRRRVLAVEGAYHDKTREIMAPLRPEELHDLIDMLERVRVNLATHSAE